MQIQINLNLNHKGCKIKRNKNIKDVVWVINLSLNRKKIYIKIKPNFVDVIVNQPKKKMITVGTNCTLCSNCVGGGQAQYLVSYIQTA